MEGGDETVMTATRKLLLTLVTKSECLMIVRMNSRWSVTANPSATWEEEREEGGGRREEGRGGGRREDGRHEGTNIICSVCINHTQVDHVIVM